MKYSEKIARPIQEVKYLHEQNAYRYRFIIRAFYQEHENINYWMYKEEIFNLVHDLPGFEDYTIDKCAADLQTLYEWGNLVAIQDTSKVKTIADFKNRLFRYQLSEYSVVIERMTIELENLSVKGASLEPSLIERIHIQLTQLKDIVKQDDEKVASWWRSLTNDFVELNRDYQDYIKTLNSASAQELMKSKEFLVFKDKLITYLRSFIKNLHRHGIAIESYLKNIDKETLDILFDKLITYERSIPRLSQTIDIEQLDAHNHSLYNNIYKWFVGENGYNEMDRLNTITNDIIRRITRYALHIGELSHQGSNRKDEYAHIAKIFHSTTSIHEAHKLSALVFGCETMLHMQGLHSKTTDDVHAKVYKDIPTYISLTPKTRVALKKKTRIAQQDYRLEREALLIERRQLFEQQNTIIQSYIEDNKLFFSHIHDLQPSIRDILLRWLSNALIDANGTSKTDQGEIFTVQLNSDKRVILQCIDGTLEMPDYVLVFKEKDV